MDWLELTVRTNTAGADMVSELLMRFGAAGTAIQDRQDAVLSPDEISRWDVADPEIALAMDEDVLVRAYLPEDVANPERVRAIREALAQPCGFDAGKLTLSIENVREEDWAENWKQYYKPFRVGRHLVVKPVWEGFSPSEGDCVIELDPGMAFGNGTHETTHLCLALLEEMVKPGDVVLDVGTGSGILAIAAGRLGASKALGVDLDPVAVRVAKVNIERNDVTDHVEARVGNLLDGVDLRADIVVANIIADAIILLSGAAARHLKPGGAFVCSGIIREREQDVRAALEKAGLSVSRAECKGEWVAIAARMS